MVDNIEKIKGLMEFDSDDTAEESMEYMLDKLDSSDTNF